MVAEALIDIVICSFGLPELLIVYKIQHLQEKSSSSYFELSRYIQKMITKHLKGKGKIWLLYAEHHIIWNNIPDNNIVGNNIFLVFGDNILKIWQKLVFIQLISIFWELSDLFYIDTNLCFNIDLVIMKTCLFLLLTQQMSCLVKSQIC